MVEVLIDILGRVQGISSIHQRSAIQTPKHPLMPRLSGIDTLDLHYTRYGREQPEKESKVYFHTSPMHLPNHQPPPLWV